MGNPYPYLIKRKVLDNIFNLRETGRLVRRGDSCNGRNGKAFYIMRFDCITKGVKSIIRPCTSILPLRALERDH